jgi:hypothetical protein
MEDKIEKTNIKDLKIVAVSDTHGEYYTIKHLIK